MKRFTFNVVIALALCIGFVAGRATAPLPQPVPASVPEPQLSFLGDQTASVVWVVDGDTIVVRWRGVEERVRLLYP